MIVSYFANAPYEVRIGSKRITFKSKVHQVFVADTRVVVVLQWSGESHADDPDRLDKLRNVLCFSSDGEQIWRIESMKNSRDVPTSYQGVGFESDGTLMITNLNQFEYKLDIHTGKISDPKYYK